MLALKQLRLSVVALRSEVRKVGEQIDLSQDAARAADACRLLKNSIAERGEEFALNRDRAFLRGEDAVLQLLELGRREALGIDQGLLAFIVGRDVTQVAARDLKVVAEDGGEADLERADAGAGAFALFNGGERGAAGAACGAQLVELRVDAGGNDAALGKRLPRARSAGWC